jgi:hypothetical protein
MDIFVTLNRLLSFNSGSNGAKLTNRSWWINRSILLWIMAMLINTPNYLVSRNVLPSAVILTPLSYSFTNTTNSSTIVVDYQRQILYLSSNNAIGESVVGELALSIWSILRGFTLLVVLFVLNVIVAVKLEAHLLKKKRLTAKRSVTITQTNLTNEAASINNNNTNSVAVGGTESGNNKNQKSKSSSSSAGSERNVTRFVLFMCTTYLIGNLPNSISPILFSVNVPTYLYNIYVVFGNTCLFLSHGSYFFVYLAFNPEFRATFRRLIF